MADTIRDELKLRRFAFVPTSRAELLDNFEADWKTALKEFPEAADDIKAAVECYALDCNTACVFHSMRVAERGLRALATALGITSTGPKRHPLEFSKWGPIIGALKTKLNSIQQSEGRSTAKAGLAKFVADAASQADYLNESFRKDVSHARGQYNAPEALNALTRSRDFMSLLTQRVSAAKPGSLL